MGALQTTQMDDYDTEQRDATPQIEPAGAFTDRVPKTDDDSKVDEPTIVDAVPSISPAEHADKGEDNLGPQCTDVVAESPIAHMPASPDKQEQSVVAEPDITSDKESPNIEEIKQASASAPITENKEARKGDKTANSEDHMNPEDVKDSVASALPKIAQLDSVVTASEEESADQDAIVGHVREMETARDQLTDDDSVPKDDSVPEDGGDLRIKHIARDDDAPRANFPSEHATHHELVLSEIGPDSGVTQKENSVLDRDPVENKGSTDDGMENQLTPMSNTQPAGDAPAIAGKSQKSEKRKRFSVADNRLVQDPSEAVTVDTVLDLAESTERHIPASDLTIDSNNADFISGAGERVEKDNPSYITNETFDETTKDSRSSSIIDQTEVAEDSLPATTAYLNDILLADTQPAEEDKKDEEKMTTSQNNEILEQRPPGNSGVVAGGNKVDFPTDELSMVELPGNDDVAQPISPSTKKKDKKKRTKKKKKQPEEVQDGGQQESPPDAEPSKEALSLEKPAQADPVQEQSVVEPIREHHAQQHTAADIIQDQPAHEEQVQKGPIQDRLLSEPLHGEPIQHESVQEDPAQNPIPEQPSQQQPASQTRHRRHTSGASLLEKTVTGAILKEYVQRQSVLDEPIQESTTADDLVKEERAVEYHVQEEPSQGIVWEEDIQQKLSDLEPVQKLMDERSIPVKTATEQLSGNEHSPEMLVQEPEPKQPADKSPVRGSLLSLGGDKEDPQRLPEERVKDPTLSDPAQVTPSIVAEAEALQPVISLEPEEPVNDEPTKKDPPSTSPTKKSKKAKKKKKQGSSRAIETAPLGEPDLRVGLSLEHEAAKVTVLDDAMGNGTKLALTKGKGEERDERPSLQAQKPIENDTDTTRTLVPSSTDQADRDDLLLDESIEAEIVEPPTKESGEPEATSSKEDDNLSQPHLSHESSLLPDVSTVALKGDGPVTATLVDKNEDITENNINVTEETCTNIVKPGDAVAGELKPSQDAVASLPIDFQRSTAALEQTPTEDAISVPEPDQPRSSNIDLKLGKAPSTASQEATMDGLPSVTHQPTRRAMEAGQHDRVKESNLGSSSQSFPPSQEPGTGLSKETADKGGERADTVWKKKSKKDKKKKKRASQVSWEEPEARIEDLPQQQQPARVFDEQPMTSEPIEMGYNKEAVENPFPKLAPDIESTSKNLRQSQVDWEPEPKIETAVKEPKPLPPTQQGQGNDALLDPRSLAEDTETSLKDSINLDDNSLETISSRKSKNEKEANRSEWNLKPSITEQAAGLLLVEQQAADNLIDPTEAPTIESVKADSEALANTEDVTPAIVSPEHLPTGLIDPDVNTEHPAKNDLNTGAHITRQLGPQPSGYSESIDNTLSEAEPPDAPHEKAADKEQSQVTLNEGIELSVHQARDVQQSIPDDFVQAKPTMILRPSDSWRKPSPRPEEPNRNEPLWDEFELNQERKSATPSESNLGAGLQISQPHNADRIEARYAMHPDLSIEEAEAEKPDKQPTVTIHSGDDSWESAAGRTGSPYHPPARGHVNAPEKSSLVTSKPRPRTPSPNRASLPVDISRTFDPSTPPNKDPRAHPVDDTLLPENAPENEPNSPAHTSRTLDSQTSPTQRTQRTTPEDSSTIRSDENKREGQHNIIVEASEPKVKLPTETPEDISGSNTANAGNGSTIAGNRSAKDDDFWVSPTTRMVERFDGTTRRVKSSATSQQPPPPTCRDLGIVEANTDNPHETIKAIAEPPMAVGVGPVGAQIKEAASAEQQPDRDDAGIPGQPEGHTSPLQASAQYTLGGPFVPSLPPPRTSSALDYNQSLAPVKEESYEDLEKIARSSSKNQTHSTSEADRGSGFVLDSPTPQRGSLSVEKNAGQRGSGVRLRDSVEATIPKLDDEAASKLIDEGAGLQAPRPRARRLRRALFEKETSQSSTLNESNRSLDNSATPEKPPEGEAQNDQTQRSVADNISDANQETVPQSDTAARRLFSIASISRMRTPESRPETPASHGIRSIHSMRSLRSSGTNTPPLRRMNRRISGDLRATSHTSPPNPSLSISTEEKEKDPTRYSTKISTSDTSDTIKDTARDVPPDRHAQQPTNITPIANEGRVRAKDMADVYDGYGEGRIGSPRSPTRPPSMRRRQSMQVLELESRIEQLLAENRALADARARAEQNLNQRNTSAISDRDAEIELLKASLQWLRNEVTRLTEVNEGLQSANSALALQHNEKFTRLESQNASVAREIEESRGAKDQYTQILEAKDAEIQELRNQLEAAKEQIRAMKKQILDTTPPDADFLRLKDEDHFDHRCQQLCSHVQQWVLRFSKFSDMRACRLTSEINDEKIIDRLDNTILDGSDVDDYLRDRVARRDIFMSMTMNMIWEFIFTRYLFGMDREQRQKLKSLEKILTEVGPTHAVRQWRAITLTLLSRRRGFSEQCSQDCEAVVQAILHTLSMILPPPSNLESQIQYQLRRVMREAVDLAIEMRTQRAEYMMLPPLQPEYDANGELTQTVTFNAALMHERSGDSSTTNEDYEARCAIVRCVLFPLVVKKGNDNGMGDDEIVVSPAQVLVAKPRRSTIRMVTPSSDVGGMSLISDSSPSAYEKSHVSVNMQNTPLTP
jgi:hypothetical protein